MGETLTTPNRIREFREARGFSQGDVVAEMARKGHQITETSLRGWEAGRHVAGGTSTIVLAQILGCSAEDLYPTVGR